MPTDLEPFYEELGKRIQGLRKRAGLTQEQLGNSIEPSLTRASVANIENAKQRVLAHTVVEIATALSVKVDDLLPTLPRQERRGSLEKELAEKLALSKGRAREMASQLLRGAVRPK